MNSFDLISGHISKAHFPDAGFDIHSASDTIVYAYSSTSVSTNLRITLPPNHFALVKPRSGMSFKNDIENGAGVIDQGYTGEIKVKLYNNSDNNYHIKKDQAIAQLIIIPLPQIAVNVLNDAIYTAPEPTIDRNDKGFGSSDSPSIIPKAVQQNKANAPKDSFATNQPSATNQSPTSMVDNALDAVGDMLNIID